MKHKHPNPEAPLETEGSLTERGKDMQEAMNERKPGPGRGHKGNTMPKSTNILKEGEVGIE